MEKIESESEMRNKNMERCNGREQKWSMRVCKCKGNAENKKSMEGV